MPRPSNPERKQTPIMIEKTDKARFRTFAKPLSEMMNVSEKPRAGNENDSQLFHRILMFFAQHNKPANDLPVSTYPGG